MAKVVNESGGLYANDIKNIKERIEEIWEKINEQL